MSRHGVCGSSNKLADHQPQDREPVTGLGAVGSPVHGRKRNASLAGFDSSPVSPSIESPDQIGGEDGSGRKRPVKRACNECRQQKVRISIAIIWSVHRLCRDSPSHNADAARHRIVD